MSETITAIEKLSQAEKWLAEAKSLDDIQEIHDIAIAAEAYARAHRLGLEAENHAMEVRLLAARRMGELILPEKPGPKINNSPELREISDVSSQRLSEFRKLAEIPMPEFKEKIEMAKAREEKISYNKFFKNESITTKWTRDPESYTPEQYIESVRQVMGSIDVDPASNDFANQKIKASLYYSVESNGLDKPWHGNVFLNPPYKQPEIKLFVEKLIQEIQAERTKQAILLTNNNTDTQWFSNAAKASTLICFTLGRINFYKPDNTITQPTNGQAFFYFGANFQKFIKEFSKFGLIYTLCHLSSN